jgi:hypothetical protein
MSAHNGRADVFVRGTDNVLWHWATSSGNSSGWERLGGQIMSWPTGATPDGVSLHAFVRGTDNHLWHASSIAGGAWSWDDLGGVIVTAPAATAESATEFHVYVQGADAALWQRPYR